MDNALPVNQRKLFSREIEMMLSRTSRAAWNCPARICVSTLLSWIHSPSNTESAWSSNSSALAYAFRLPLRSPREYNSAPSATNSLRKIVASRLSVSRGASIAENVLSPYRRSISEAMKPDTAGESSALAEPYCLIIWWNNSGFFSKSRSASRISLLSTASLNWFRRSDLSRAATSVNSRYHGDPASMDMYFSKASWASRCKCSFR